MPSHFLNYLNENSRSPLLQNSQSNAKSNVIGRPLNDPLNFDSILAK